MMLALSYHGFGLTTRILHCLSQVDLAESQKMWDVVEVLQKFVTESKQVCLLIVMTFPHIPNCSNTRTDSMGGNGHE